MELGDDKGPGQWNGDRDKTMSRSGVRSFPAPIWKAKSIHPHFLMCLSLTCLYLKLLWRGKGWKSLWTWESSWK